MKILKNCSSEVIILSIILLIILFLNIIWNIHPVLDLMMYLQNQNYFWTVPTTVCLIIGLWIYDRNMRRKILKERVEIFNATIRTIQDILQNSTSSMQLLIMDMKDEGVHEEFIQKAEKNIMELIKVINTLAAVDPKNIELKDLNSNLSIIKMNK
jgi:hypothetical protein